MLLLNVCGANTQLDEMKVVLDEIGADIGCAVPSGTKELAVARPEAIYFYSPDGRGPCYVFEGPVSA